MKKKSHLIHEDRFVIETLIRQGTTLQKLADYLNKEKTTIYREIKNRRTLINENAITDCKQTNKFPYVCGKCPKKGSCKHKRYSYHARNAELNYQVKLRDSRRGIDLDEDELEYLNNLLFDKIANNNQSLHHFLITYKDEIPVSLSTIYRYIDNGYFRSFGLEYTHRKLSFKPRRRRQEVVITVDPNYRLYRKYKDYKKYLAENPKASIVEIDLVIGTADDSSAILTMLFKDSKLMLMFKVKKYSPNNIISVFNSLKRSLGVEQFKELFEVILADNGVEFCKPAEIEVDPETGEILSNFFYCDPYRSNQKGTLEKNHSFIRYIRPKGLSFDDLNTNSVINMQNHINNTIRKSLNDSTPYLVFTKQYGAIIAKKLNLKYIKPKDVSLSYKILK